MGANAEHNTTARNPPGDRTLTATSDTRSRSNRLPRHERRRQLLDAALAVFVSQGYRAAAMDEIAERAGVSKPVLYQHFPGKLELYLALLDESVDTLVDTVRDALRSNPDPKQRVAATFGAYFEYVGGQGQAYRLIFESDLSNEPAVRDRLDLVQRQCAEMVSPTGREDGAHSVFALSMSKGGKVLVPADKIAYVEFGAPESRRVGFGNIV